MKKYKVIIIFWITAVLIFLTQGLMPIFTSNSPETKQALTHLGYPAYFGLMLAVFKLLGGLAIIIPQVPRRVKEWAYAGFMIDFICAFISITAADGFGGMSVIPLVAIVILIISYIAFDKMHSNPVK
ncbi:DoxX family protein [Chitinophagaceae bacterium MMS25-I14]